MTELLQTSAPPLGIVLLAAGEGSRMGGVPKCLIRIDGQPLIRRSLAAMQAAGASCVVVVTGHYADAIEPLVDPALARIVRNPAPERGQGSSVRLGLEALVGRCDIVLIALADQPLLGADDVGELLGAFQRRAEGIRAVYPSVGGKRGNPVVLDGSLVRELVASGQADAVRPFLDQHPQQVQVLHTANDAFIIDLDTRDDVAAFEARIARRVELPGPTAK